MTSALVFVSYQIMQLLTQLSEKQGRGSLCLFLAPMEGDIFLKEGF